MIEKQIHMYLNFADLKIDIFRDLRVFVLSPIPKNENSEITEILQKRHNTEIRECSLKNSLDVLQITNKSQYDSAIFPIRYQVFVL